MKEARNQRERKHINTFSKRKTLQIASDIFSLLMTEFNLLNYEIEVSLGSYFSVIKQGLVGCKTKRH